MSIRKSGFGLFDPIELPVEKRQKAINLPPAFWAFGYDYGLLMKQAHTIPNTEIESESDTKSKQLPIDVLPKIASFDIDGTIIRTKSGAIMPTDEHDYILESHVVETLQKLHKIGYEIVFFTNQVQCQEDAVAAQQIMDKIDEIISIVGIPISVYVSIKKDAFRKPSRGMWDVMLDAYYVLLEQKYPSYAPFETVVNVAESFYVGDAAGRAGVTASVLKKKPGSFLKDHSSTDYEFALNIFGKRHITKHFFVPEVFFMKSNSTFPPQNLAPEQYDQAHLKTTSWSLRSTEPGDIISRALVPGSSSSSSSSNSSSPGPEFDQIHHQLQSLPIFPFLSNKELKKKQCIILVGPPACGKSTFAMKFVNYTKAVCPSSTWTRVNQDTLGSLKACINAAQDEFQKGHSVIVDNTNPTAKVRQEFIELCQKNKVPVHCIFLHDADRTLVQHLNTLRTSIISSQGMFRAGPIPLSVVKLDFVLKKPTKSKIFSSAPVSCATSFTVSDPSLFPPVPTVAINMFFSRLEPPEANENFKSISLLNWLPHDIPVEMIKNIQDKSQTIDHSDVHLPVHGISSKSPSELHVIEWGRQYRPTAPVTSSRTFLDYFFQRYHL